MHDNLVYDVGSHVGHDVAYYLHRGFGVVAIDANPKLIERVRERFPAEVKEERLHVVNAAIGSDEGDSDLWLSASDDGSSSIFRAEVTDVAGSIRVHRLPLSAVLERFGVPFYIKVDIQGADRFCLEALRAEDPPRYLSWEAGPDALECLDIVRALGYRGFKCIDQTVFRQMENFLSVKGRLMQKLRRRLGRETERGVRRGGWTFIPGHSSGPFGEDTDGPWRSFERVRDEWQEFLVRYPPPRRAPAWYDFHARVS